MAKTKLKRYTNIPLPNELVKQIDYFIKHGQCGYKTKSEFVKEAVRQKIADIIKLEALKRDYKK